MKISVGLFGYFKIKDRKRKNPMDRDGELVEYIRTITASVDTIAIDAQGVVVTFQASGECGYKISLEDIIGFSPINIPDVTFTL